MGELTSLILMDYCNLNSAFTAFTRGVKWCFNTLVFTMPSNKKEMNMTCILRLSMPISCRMKLDESRR